MAKRDLTPAERAVKARRVDYTKSFEAAVGAVLDSMPMGARKAFAARMGRSPQWVSRLTQRRDVLGLGGSDDGQEHDSHPHAEPEEAGDQCNHDAVLHEASVPRGGRTVNPSARSPRCSMR